MDEKNKNKQRRKPVWTLILLLQTAVMLLLGVLTALSYWLGSVPHAVLFWGVMPIAGLAAACISTRLGLLNYAAWIVPPACGLLGHCLVWTYLPPFGPILLCAFTSLIGAAAGEVLKRQDKAAD